MFDLIQFVYFLNVIYKEHKKNVKQTRGEEDFGVWLKVGGHGALVPHS